MHFKLDENIPVKLKPFLKSLGHEASTVFDENLSGIKDMELIEICRKEKFVFIALDSDFSNIVSYPTNTHYGIIVFKIRSQGSDSVTGLFKNLINAMDIKHAQNSITIVEKDRVKIRK